MEIDWTNYYIEDKKTDWDRYYEYLSEKEDFAWKDNCDE